MPDANKETDNDTLLQAFSSRLMQVEQTSANADPPREIIPQCLKWRDPEAHIESPFRSAFFA